MHIRVMLIGGAGSWLVRKEISFCKACLAISEEIIACTSEYHFDASV